jgi:methionyl-tRNA formyltransferase
MNPPRILFFGYSEVGTECLSLLLERGDHVVALFTHEDHPTEKIWFRTPATVARAHAIPVLTPPSVNTPEWIARVAELAPDLILSAYYRHLISPDILALARLGAFNLHGSLLPRYRGRAPINWAVLHGETQIGMTLHRMVKRADAGALVDQEAVFIEPMDSAAEAFRKVLPCARRVLARQIDALLAGTAPEIPQDESQATVFRARTAEDGRIDWTRSAREIFNLVRAVTDPFPGAFTDVGPSRLMVWWAEVIATPCSRPPGEILSSQPLVVATGDGALKLTKTEWRGPAVALAAGHQIPL